MLKTLLQAILMTLKGEKPIRKHSKLSDWMETSARLSDQFIQEAQRDQLDLTQFSAKVDGRNQTLKIVINAVNYHAKTEFIYLLRHLTEHSITAIYATNMNDAYALKRILDNLDSSTPLDKKYHQQLSELSKHLDSIPPSNDLAQ